MTTTMDLDELIRLEDAIEAITQGHTHVQFVDCHKAEYRVEAGNAFDAAQELIWTHKSARKALNEVQRQIETYR